MTTQELVNQFTAQYSSAKDRLLGQAHG